MKPLSSQYNQSYPIPLYNQTAEFKHQLEGYDDKTTNYNLDLNYRNSLNLYEYTSLQNQDQPFKYDYLLNLFTTPDMASYLSQSVITDDVYALPIHLQRLLLEAKEEVVLARTRLNHDGQSLSPANHPALERLERVRSFCWLRSDADIANLMSSVVELVADDDELEHILMD
ncbi:hypothetical protein BCR42DRAFT_423928 [Absidia repens]|uniref:Uncharacterized protein n=1 Tax=Absidia repens TaxID=90262 RepID=A0A1X2I4R3_9FUNG|nr:hypothetical protein BCR42DRAFT_423928 [Absidia repens]